MVPAWVPLAIVAKRAVEEGLNIISAPMTRGPTSGLGGVCVSVIATGFGRGGLSYGAVALNSIWAMGRRPPLGVAPSGGDREAAYAGG